jgi:hypothetical protein
MSHWEPAAYKDYQWIVADPQLLGGKLAIRGTRLAVSLILECLAAACLWKTSISPLMVSFRTRRYRRCSR